MCPRRPGRNTASPPPTARSQSRIPRSLPATRPSSPDSRADQTYHYRVWGRNSPLYTNACSADQTFYSLPPPSPQLQNGSFEDGHGSWARSLYPWVQYTTGNGVVGYHPIDGLVGPYPGSGPLAWLQNVRAYDGTFFLGAGAEWGYKSGGVYQRVNVPPGQVCTLSARYLSLNVGGVPRTTRGSGLASTPTVAWTRQARVYSGGACSRRPTTTNGTPPRYTTTAGGTGVVTVFLDIKEQYQLQWHVAALDRIAFGPPVPMTIGELKQSDGDRGAMLSGKIVTQVDPNSVSLQRRGLRPGVHRGGGSLFRHRGALRPERAGHSECRRPHRPDRLRRAQQQHGSHADRLPMDRAWRAESMLPRPILACPPEPLAAPRRSSPRSSLARARATWGSACA